MFQGAEVEIRLWHAEASAYMVRSSHSNIVQFLVEGSCV